MLLRKLTKLDYFSHQPKINFKNKDNHATWLGLITTFSIFIVIILTLSKFSQNLLYKTKPFILNSKKHFHNVPQFDLSKDGFFMSFFLNHGVTDFIMDPALFTIDCHLQVVTATDSGGIDVKLLPIELEPCTKDHFPTGADEKSMNRLHYEKNYCFKKNSTNNPVLEGFWGMEKFNMLFVKFKKCRNSTNSSVVCQPEEVINEVLRVGYFGANVLDNFLDLEDFESPVKRNFDSPYTRSSEYLYKEYDIYLQSRVVITDEGWLVPNLKVEESVALLREKEMASSYKDVEDGFFGSLVFRMYSVQDIYERKYDKLQDVLANIGGLLKFLLVIGSLVINPFIRIDFMQKFANSIFNFDDSLSSTPKKPCKWSKTKEVVTKSEDEFEPDELNYICKNIHNPETKIDLLDLDDLLNENRKNIKLGIIDRISLVLGFKTNTKTRAFQNSVDKIIENTDIILIMKKLLEFDKLKMVLFDENQLKIFNYITTAKVYPNTIKKGLPEMCIKENTKPQSQIKSHAKRTPGETDQQDAFTTKIDKRLLSLIETERLKNYLRNDLLKNTDKHEVPKMSTPISTKKALNF